MTQLCTSCNHEREAHSWQIGNSECMAEIDSHGTRCLCQEFVIPVVEETSGGETMNQTTLVTCAKCDKDGIVTIEASTKATVQNTFECVYNITPPQGWLMQSVFRNAGMPCMTCRFICPECRAKLVSNA